MTKLLKTITTIAALATTLITVSIYASAQSPVDNGSNARAEMAQNGLIAGQTAESNAFPGWIVLSTAGAAVLVGGGYSPAGRSLHRYDLRRIRHAAKTDG